jgi:hypothetical protein
LQALDEAIQSMSKAVPAPQRARTASGHSAYRFAEKLPQQALLLKSVRLVGAVKAGKLLIDAGLSMDAGASMRLQDELGSDIQFLAGPLVMGGPPEPRHDQYLEEFFQEEFDHADPIQATQSRNRVSRRHIRAYVARTYGAGLPVSQIVAVTETIDNAFSGYVHGAGSHIMDAYDGRRFHTSLEPGDGPLEAIKEQYPQYLHRALMSVALAAKSVGMEELFQTLYRLQLDWFDDYGDIR